jgi:hypothetical protein
MLVHFTTKTVLLILALIVTLGLILVLYVSPPRSWNDSEPPGWPNKYPEKTLPGMVAGSGRLAHELWVTPPVYARAVAYASAAYWDAYRADSSSRSVFSYPSSGKASPDAGVTAYSIVFNELLPTPSTKIFRDHYDSGDERGEEAAKATLSAASMDGFSDTPRGYAEILKEDGIPELDKHSVWLPIYYSGAISEPDWGSLRPIFPEVLDCAAPPPLYSKEFLENEGERFASFHADNRKFMGLYSTIHTAWNTPIFLSYSISNLSLENVLNNALTDNSVDLKTADFLFLQNSIMSNDLYIVVYRDKYKYKVPAIQNFHEVMTIAVPAFPSYPSLAGGQSAVLEGLLSQIGNVRPRLEIPGSLLNQQWNRVFENPSEMAKEIVSVSYAAGGGFTSDYQPGVDLGECVFNIESKILKDKR